MIILRHVKAAEARHKQRERERDSERERGIKRERERGKKPLATENERGIFSMMGFDAATSSFLALLVDKSKRLKNAKLTNSQQKVKEFLPQKFCQVTHLQGLKGFVGQ